MENGRTLHNTWTVTSKRVPQHTSYRLSAVWDFRNGVGLVRGLHLFSRNCRKLIHCLVGSRFNHNVIR